LKFNWVDMIYHTELFLSNDIIQELNRKVYCLLYKDKTFISHWIIMFMEEINFKQYYNLLKSEYFFYKEIFHNRDIIKFYFEMIQTLFWDDFTDVNLLENFNNKEIYYNFSKNITNKLTLSTDFYKINDTEKWCFYYIDWFIDSNNLRKKINIRNKVPMFILFLLWFYEYRKFSNWYLELAKNFVKNLNTTTEWELSWTWFDIRKIFKRLDLYLKM
jgi:hypothetical protein